MATTIPTEGSGVGSAVVSDHAPPRLGSYGLYAAGVLMVVYAFAFLDRQILNLMVGPLERTLHISDSQFALLTGASFGVFYTVMGLPLGWLADRCNRNSYRCACQAISSHSGCVFRASFASSSTL